MKKLLIFISFTVGLLIGTMASRLFSQDWEIQAEGLAYNWSVIDAVDSNIAIAHALETKTGQLSIFRTLNGGKTWQSLPLNQRDFWTIRFYNEKLGLAAWKGNQEIF